MKKKLKPNIIIKDILIVTLLNNEIDIFIFFFFGNIHLLRINWWSLWHEEEKKNLNKLFIYIDIDNEKVNK